MTRRTVCLHGHFYQPPRENPWIEEVEVQDSAAPFHDWNERIAAECYGPNGAARLKNGQGRIVDIVNNYVHLSFNFGPTLLAWLERHSPGVYRQILDADARSVRERGQGNAIAQSYNHAILPLCNDRDLQTQIGWGLADFRHRFRREPEGIWLPETAADLRTLQALAANGLRFTVLSPEQCTRVRAPGGEWMDARGARFDPTRPYRVKLPLRRLVQRLLLRRPHRARGSVRRSAEQRRRSAPPAGGRLLRGARPRRSAHGGGGRRDLRAPPQGRR